MGKERRSSLFTAFNGIQPHPQHGPSRNIFICTCAAFQESSGKFGLCLKSQSKPPHCDCDETEWAARAEGRQGPSIFHRVKVKERKTTNEGELSWPTRIPVSGLSNCVKVVGAPEEPSTALQHRLKLQL